MSDGKAYHHGNLKQALVQAGLEILETEGRERLTLRACAAKAGVSHAAPKNHFASLKDLLAAIAAEGFRQFNTAQREAIAGVHADQALQEAMTSYVAFAESHSDLFRLMWSRDLISHDQDNLRHQADKAAEALSQLVVTTGLKKSSSDDTPGKAELLVWCLAHGFAHLRLEGMIETSRNPGEEFLGIGDLHKFLGSKHVNDA